MNAWDKAKGRRSASGPVHPAAALRKADGPALHARAAASHGKRKLAAAGHLIARRRRSHPSA